jgi:hypothetical protein
MSQQTADLLEAMIVNSARSDTERNALVAQSLAQGLGVIQNLTLQAQAGVSDDSGLIAALQTATGAPRQGSHGVNT